MSWGSGNTERWRTAELYCLGAEHLAVVAAERRQFELAARLLGHLDHWYDTHTDFYRDLNEQKSCLRTRALLAAALSDKDRDRLMRQGAGWSEAKATEEALAI